MQYYYLRHAFDYRSAVSETNPAHPPNNHTPIFPTDHAPLLVIEDGSLRTLHRLVGGTDVAMVMLYAPWCFHSIRLAKTFVELAKNQEEVWFAINNNYIHLNFPPYAF